MPDKYICVPNSNSAQVINKCLSKSGLKIATSTGEKIGHITKKKMTKRVNHNSVVYSIPCGGCPKEYIGETGRGMKKRINEHRRDVKNHNTANSLVRHIEQSNHLPKWEAATEVEVGLKKNMRRAIEAALITTKNKDISNHREGFVRWAGYAAKLALKSGSKGEPDKGITPPDQRVCLTPGGGPRVQVPNGIFLMLYI